jgi:hypothetical protein
MVGCLGTPEEAEQALHGKGYDPVPPMATNCNCTPTNGTCNADCTITCTTGFGDCDANLANGCETQLNTTSDCGQCGKECSCYGGAMCINGACAGTPEPNGTPCSSPGTACTGGSGVCMNLACTCGTSSADMSHPGTEPDLSTGTTSATGSTTSGHGKSGSCAIGAGELSGMLPLFMVLVYFGLVRRRRSDSV